MASAVITNPFSNKSMDSAISMALAMPEDERRGRMAAMRDITRKQDVRYWADDQMHAFDAADLPPAASNAASNTA
jgi:trehalose-6-phosphate synthase